MTQSFFAPLISKRFLLIAFLAIALSVLIHGQASAMLNQGVLSGLMTDSLGINVSGNSAVGGVQVNTAGMLKNATAIERTDFAKRMAAQLTPAPEGLREQTTMRKVSLKKLDATIRQSLDAGQSIPESVLYLGGLQSVRYVVAEPENNDIVLIGPGEAWKVDELGAVVGVTTNRPVLLLDDLATILRASNTNRPEVITCSIDPTKEGLLRLQNASKGGRVLGTPQQTATVYRQALGPQTISVTGVPDTSHYARVLVSADYRMKRIGMQFDPSPIAELPSYMSMARGGRLQPRWWMTPDFKTLMHDDSRMAWEIPGAAVKTVSENDYLDEQGVRHGTGSSDPITERWATLMTENYDKLAGADPVFGQLQNCMDLAVVAAIMFKEDMIGKTGCNMPALLDESIFKTVKYSAPKEVETNSTVVRRSREWLVGCGGVEINPWAAVDKSETKPELSALAKQATVTGENWWAN